MSRLIGGILIGLGTAIGISGGVVMATGGKKKSKPSQVPPTAESKSTVESKPSRVPPAAESKPSQVTAAEIKVTGTDAKYTVLGTRTRYLTERHPLYNTLYMFYNRLVKTEEREMFHQAVADIDNILALNTLLTNGQVDSIASIPSDAMIFNTRAQRLMRAIVEFSAITMPSETKKQDMTNQAADIAKMLDDIMQNMQRTLASMDIDRIHRD